MNLKGKILFPSLFVYTLIIFQTVFCQVKLPHLISDGMVLQRDTKVKIWGWATRGENITVSFKDKKYKTIADHDGKWELVLSEMDAGGPYSMEIAASNRITLKNILVGDVWVCSGQSNMVLPISRVRDLYEEEIDRSENPDIRHFFAPMHYDFNQPQENLQSGSWKSACPKNILKFSATAIFLLKL